MSSSKPLAGKVAVVAGGTRGGGRGIAVMLGEAGATVYVTGRSVRGNPATEGRPETIEETAELVNERGGIGIAVRTDHTLEADVKAVVALACDPNVNDKAGQTLMSGDVADEYGFDDADGSHPNWNTYARKTFGQERTDG